MKKTRIVLIAIGISLTFISCQKNNTNPSNNNSAATCTTCTATSGTTSIIGAYSQLNVSKNIYKLGPGYTNDSSAFAAFFTGPNTQSITNTTVNSVSINGNALMYNSSSVYYTTGSNTLNVTAPIIWNVAGSGTITSFSYTYTPNFPKYSGMALIPDTISKSSSITFSIAGMSNTLANTILTITGASSITKILYTAPNGNIALTLSEVQQICAGSTSNLILNLANSNSYGVYLGGHLQGFYSSINFMKSIVVKP